MDIGDAATIFVFSDPAAGSEIGSWSELTEAVVIEVEASFEF